jgi:2-keto-4-pentenoate hydratase/2-oxohepta-3-ene-1,7-dioic acid hydratase in catechol pathway
LPTSAPISRFARLALERGPTYARLDESAWMVLDAPPWASPRESGERVSFTAAQLLVPCLPSKIVCVGRNYADHAREMASEVPEEPVLFFKPPSALLAPGDAIVLPANVGRVDHEAEMALVLGAHVRSASLDEARRAIFGVTGVNDVSARVLQKKDGQWGRAKGFDTFCPMGPVIARGLDPDALAVRSRVNGAIRQDGHTRDLLVKSAELVAFVSRVMTLEPGDVISTGTPAGVGPLAPGDVVEIEVEDVGTFANPVVAESEARRDRGAI